MAKYIKIKNWSRWQSYRKDRGQPPWIKLHRCLFRNYEWCTLSDSEKGQLVMIWMLAADNDGKIPAEPEKVKVLCGMGKEPDYKMFKNKGFLDFGANVTPTRRQGDAKVKLSDTPVGDNFLGDVCKPVETQALSDFGANVTPQRQKQRKIRLETEEEKDTERAREPAKTSKRVVPQKLSEPLDVEKIRQNCTPGPAADMARLLSVKILENDPHRNAPPNLEPWVIQIQRLNSGGRPWSEIEAVIRWSQADDFWRANILDARSLAKNFTTLLLQSKRVAAPARNEPIATKNMRLLEKLERRTNEDNEKKTRMGAN